jgi:galactokinase
VRAQVLASFESTYGCPPAHLVRAPGRANLIGEHTDYNDGFVMPLAIDRALWLAIAPRADNTLRVHSLDFGAETATFSTGQLQDESLPHWTQHVRGGWWLLSRKGYALPGVDVALGGDLPIGAGISSSAAIGVAVIEALLAVVGSVSHSQIEKALLAVELENEFIGMPCGVMDQIASAAAIDGSAMLLDCRSLETQSVSIPEETRIVLMNTLKNRELADSAYAERRAQSEEAAAILGVPALRDATMQMVDARREDLGDVRYRRARHVVLENQRTLSMQAVLAQGDLVAAGNLLNASHASLRDDYEVSCRELDLMSELARSHPACYGARMMGGGFGGSAIGMVRADESDRFVAATQAAYREKTGLTPELYICRASAGSHTERITG